MKILIAEDDSVSRILLRQVLITGGHQVVEATDGVSAWTHLTGPEGPRLAILDWIMPGKDGLSICEQLQAMNLARPPYIILLTTRHDTTSMVEGLRAGAHDYLSKPFNAEELLARVEVGRRILTLQDHLAEQTQELSTTKAHDRTSSLMVESLLDAIPDVIGIQDNKHRIIRYNRAGYDFLKMTPEEVRGRLCYELLGHDTPCPVCATSETYQTLRPARVERFIPEMGVWLDARSYPVLNAQGAIELVIEHLRDITDRKLMEQQLKESENRMRTLNDNLTSGMVYQLVRAPDGRRIFTYLSDAVHKLYGITPEQGMSDANRIYDRVHPEDLERVRNGEEAAEAAMAVFRSEVRMLNPDGSIRWSSFVSTPRKLPDGSTCWDGIEFDATEQHRAAEEQQELKEQLHQAQKMESIGRLAGGVAHDFNNMLGVILGHAELALEQASPSQPLYQDLQEIRKAAQRSADLTRQLLAFARKQTIHPRPLNLNATIAGLLHMLRRVLGENIELVWKPSDPLWPILMDPVQVDQILVNLAANARDAIEDTGALVIATENVAVTQPLPGGPPMGQYIHLSVRDNGKGMAPEALQHLFEPFFTTKDLGRGTGLGLATIYGIVQQNGGHIQVESQAGQGTLFHIYFPRGAKNPEQAASQKVQASERGTGTILLVEDEPAILAMSKTMLENQGYALLTASSPSEAIQQMRHHEGPIDLLVTDVIMPEMNGQELYRQLAAWRPGLKVLFMSGYTASAITHHGVAENTQAFLQKPFTIQALVNKVHEILKPSASSKKLGK